MTYSTPQVTEQEKPGPKGRSQKFRITIAIIVMLALSPLSYFDDGNLIQLLIAVVGGFVYARLGKPVSKSRAAFESARFMAILTAVISIVTVVALFVTLAVIFGSSDDFHFPIIGGAGVLLLFAMFVIIALVSVGFGLFGALGGFLAAALRKDKPVAESQKSGSDFQPFDPDDPWASSGRPSSYKINPGSHTSDPWA